MTRVLLIVILWLGVLLPSSTFAANVLTGRCTAGVPRLGCGFDAEGKAALGDVAKESEWGPILCDVCARCVDSGDCTLTDLMIATGNVGNYALGLTGAIALLLFVIGGIHWILAAGREDWVKKGFSFLKAAVIGLTIAFAAQLLLQTVKNAIISGTTGSSQSTGPVDCSISEDQTPCGTNSACYNGQCLTLCALRQMASEILYTNELDLYTEEMTDAVTSSSDVRPEPVPQTFQCTSSQDVVEFFSGDCYENECANSNELCCDTNDTSAVPSIED